MEDKFQIDSLDKKILSIITKNARMPFLEVARSCNVSGAAIHQRIQKMTNMGVVSGSQFTVDPSRLGYKTCAYIGIFLEKSSLFDSVVDQLFAIPEIVQCHYTTGEYSMFIKVYAKDNEHLRVVLGEKLQAINGISRTETFISLEQMLDRQVPIE
jgi:Lrp/AsnC family transcriptional regulator for asnA, asnC and gidA